MPFVSALLLQPPPALLPSAQPRVAPLVWVPVPDPSAESLGVGYISNFKKVTLYIDCMYSQQNLGASPEIQLIPFLQSNLGMFTLGENKECL